MIALMAKEACTMSQKFRISPTCGLKPIVWNWKELENLKIRTSKFSFNGKFEITRKYAPVKISQCAVVSSSLTLTLWHVQQTKGLEYSCPVVSLKSWKCFVFASTTQGSCSLDCKLILAKQTPEECLSF